MEFFRFCKWWLNRRDDMEIALLCIVPTFLIFLLSLYLFGPIALVVLIVLLVSFVIGFFIYKIISYFRKQWTEYTLRRDQERDRIISRLKGHNV